VEEHAYLTLGCYGRKENGFVLCPSIENRILKLSESLVNFDKLMDYLDSIKLFDRPIINQNAIIHLVYHIQDKFNQKIKPIWTDHEYHLIERFIQMHKNCGIYSQIILTAEELVDKTQVDTPIFIKNSKEPLLNLTNIRGRRF
jgi:hypothetical protein